MSPVDFYHSSAWRYFSKYVLLYYSRDNETVNCITCNRNMELTSKKSCCGHLIKVYDSNSTNFATALEFTNVGPQCATCNNDLHGNENMMKEALMRIHGKEEIEKLYIKRRQVEKMSKTILKILTPVFKERFKALVKERGINPWK
jgi:hypothetical protein